MKGMLGIFLAGVATGLLLDPVSGRERRTMLGKRLAPLRKRVMEAKDRAAASDIVGDTADTLQDAAGTLQNTVESARSSAEGTLTGAADSLVRRLDDAATMLSSTPPPPAASAGTGASTPARAPGAAASTGTTSPDAADMKGFPRDVPDPIAEGTPNDPTLLARVESELFRDRSIPRGQMSLDAADGVVTLRGTVDPGMADEVLERTRSVEGVRQVVDMLQRR